MTIGEHFSVKQFGSYLGEQFLNTWAYRQTSGAAINAAAILLSAFEATVITHLPDATSTTTLFDRVECFAIENPTDYIDKVPNKTAGVRVIGTIAQSPSWVAFGYRSNRAGAGSRASYKRFCGIGESDVEQNVLSSTFEALAAVGFLQTALGAALVGGSGDTFVPVQLKAGWSPGLPPVENFVITGYAPAYLTSQVSRRP